MEPLDLYASLKPLVNQDIRRVVDEMLTADKYSVSNTQGHTHNGVDAVQIPTANLSDALNYLVSQSRSHGLESSLTEKALPLWGHPPT